MATILHDSDCSTHNAPAMPVGPCDCGASTLARCVEVLQEIADMHLGDCPASINEDEFSRNHIWKIRLIASNFLREIRKDRSR